MKDEMLLDRLWIRISPKEKEEMKAFAQKKGITLSQLIRETVLERMKKETR